MRTHLLVKTAVGAGLLSLVLATSGDAWVGHTNYLRFSGPVALPGLTLAAGEYTFEKAWDMHGVVRVREGRGGKPIFMAYTRGVTRPPSLPASHMISFGEVVRGQPTRIATWYELGSNDGHEFIYADSR